MSSKHKSDHKPKPQMPLKTGKLEIARNGNGFVLVPGLSKDIMIWPEHINQGFDGDEVRVEILKEGKGGRMEGRVVQVVKRKQKEFTGKIEKSKNFAFFIADSEKMKTDIFIPLHLLLNADHGDQVVARITEWPERAKNPVGEVVRILTDESRNERAMLGIIMESGFPLEFSETAVAEAKTHTDAIDPAELSKRKDFRDTLTLTIDPLDAKDFDDAISIKPLEKGLYEIGVHIADVSHFLPVGSPLDKEAYERATSVYLPDRVLPMLPENLSNHLCSLRPNEDKYAFSAVFTMNEDGHVSNTWIGRTVIRSKRRFTYEEVQTMIEGAEGAYKNELTTLNAIARKLRAQRMANGAINFSSQEVKFVLDDQAKPIAVVVKESKEAHQLVEEMMLLANRKVAEYISKIRVKAKPLPFPYRIHDEPNEEKLSVFSAFAARYGHKFDTKNTDTIAASFNEMLQMVHGRPEQHVLETLGIRTMAKAVYHTENIGHYGLGFENYCHFTSPIRRYPDVLVHRILQDALDGKPTPMAQIDEMCKHCSDQERKAMEAERAANKYKQVEYLMDFIGEEFDAVVSGVSAFGFWSETVEHKCEGLVPIQDMLNIDQFELMPEDYALIGKTTGLRIRMGDRVRIKVVAASLEKRQIDYSLVALLVEQSANIIPVKERQHKSGGKQKYSGKKQKNK